MFRFGAWFPGFVCLIGAIVGGSGRPNLRCGLSELIALCSAGCYFASIEANLQLYHGCFVREKVSTFCAG